MSPEVFDFSSLTTPESAAFIKSCETAVREYGLRKAVVVSEEDSVFAFLEEFSDQWLVGSNNMIGCQNWYIEYY
jgi:hypothetical protein